MGDDNEDDIVASAGDQPEVIEDADLEDVDGGWSFRGIKGRPTTVTGLNDPGSIGSLAETIYAGAGSDDFGINPLGKKGFPNPFGGT